GQLGVQVIATVPQDDKWDKKLTIEDLRDWFATSSTPHACWRKEALSECLSRVDRVVKIGRQETLQFSQEFASFLRTQPGDFSHKPTDDNWGLIITFPKRPTNMQFTWKIGKSCVDLTFWGPYVGKAQHIPIPVNIRPEFAHSKQKSDMFKIDVPFVDVSTPLEGQHEVLAAVMTALYELIAFAGLVSLSD
ncbi:MAG TPA: hypothetical protein DHH36_21450, partial [Afipia sp.]|nr:hypothetical protein [Afipia sp.]